MKKIPQKIQELFFSEENNILFFPIIFAIGIAIASKVNFNGGYYYPAAILLLSFMGMFIYKESFAIKNTLLLILFFFFGFLWMKFYAEKIVNSPKLEYAIYANVKGKIVSIKNYQDQNEKTLSQKITLGDLEFSQPKYKKKKLKKLTKRYFNNNYLGSSEFLDLNPHLRHKKYHDFEDKTFQIPKKIIINNKISPKDLKIGDFISTTAFLNKIPENKIFDNFDYKKKIFFDQIGGSGYATKNIKIIQRAKRSNLENKILNFRQKIAAKINNAIPKEHSSVVNALLLGLRGSISHENMDNIRNSGLMHLLAISGLHIGLAAAMFFFSIRLLLSRSCFLTTHYDIKKISAILAILSSGGYLILAGAPISAIRAFFMVSLLFLAILLDKKTNLFRSIALALLIILIFNPSNILKVGFALSFMAVFTIIATCNSLLRKKEDDLPQNFLEKIIFYLFSIVVTSLMVQIFTGIFIIYHFNHYQVYGILANLIAIPLVSFIILPLSFISLFAIPTGLEFLPLEILGYFVQKLLNLSEFVANLKFSNFNIRNIPSSAFLLIIFGQVLFCVWKKNLRFLGFLPIIVGTLIAALTPLPKLIINKNVSFFAVFKNEKLIISSDRSFEAKSLSKKFGKDEYFLIKDEFDQNNFCQKNFCRLRVEKKDILIVKKRVKKDFVCNFEGNMVINLNKNYLLPKCKRGLEIIDYKDILGIGMTL